jgi:4-hydroxythreonine-4-phosphate dehydrogenase
MGDPAGIGPEVVLKAVGIAPHARRFVVLGDLTVLLPVLSLSQLPAESRIPGQPTPTGGEASYQYVAVGIQLALQATLQGVVTAPISKAMWHAAGRDYPGHTELLATLTHTPEVRMMLVSSRLRVILVTTHMALSQVPGALSSERILKTLVLTAAHLSRFHGLPRPRLAVAGLNPHAGEAGAFGDEEERIITPAVQQARGQGLLAQGPFPADSLFVRAVRGEFDGVICLYHDQGLIPLKLLSWEEGVNVTIGLPIVRTSPDHGTAFDIAGQGKADPRSMSAALALAAEMTRNRSADESAYLS